MYRRPHFSQNTLLILQIHSVEIIADVKVRQIITFVNVKSKQLEQQNTWTHPTWTHDQRISYFRSSQLPKRSENQMIGINPSDSPPALYLQYTISTWHHRPIQCTSIGPCWHWEIMTWGSLVTYRLKHSGTSRPELSS